MKLRELLQTLQQVQQKIGSSPVFICGGTPRDKYLGKLDNISDIDLTSGDKTISYTAQEFATELRKNYNITYKVLEDHSSIFVGSLKLDFSSNFTVPNVETILKKMGIEQPSEMQREMFSRDFTCNSLLLTLDLKTISDPTHRGFKDIKDKKIRTCLSPEITLTSNRNRVVRSIYLACKLGFDVDQSIIDFVRKHPDSIKISSEKAMTEKLNEAFSRDANKASQLLTKMAVWNYVPITEVMYPYYTKHVKETNVK